MKEYLPELEQEERRSWEAGTWTHLPYVILRDLTEQRLDEVDQEIVQAHLELCSACRKEADDLRVLCQSLQEAPTPAPARNRRYPLWLPALGALAGAGALALVLLPTLKNAERLAQAQSEQQARLTRLEQALASTPMPQSTPTPLPSTPTPSTPQPQTTPDPELSLLRRKVALLERQMQAASRRTSPIQVALAPPELPDLRGLQVARQRSMEAGAVTYALISPVNEVIKVTRPELRWEPCPNAVRYKVLVARVGELQPLTQGETLAPKTTWQPERALPRGTALTWEVHAYDSAGQELAEAPLARFQCLTEAQEKRIQKAPTALARARAQAEAGLFSEAQATLLLLTDSPQKRVLLTALARATEER